MKGIGRAWIALVSSVALAEEDIRDIRGPKALSAGSWLMIAMVGGAVIGVALCAYFIWRRRRVRGHHTNLTPAQEAKPVYTHPWFHCFSAMRGCEYLSLLPFLPGINPYLFCK